jgi:protein-tyrosine phosphatase
MPEDVFSILAVCTGNVCRSPAAERLLASKLGPTVCVSSAGTHALVGHPISKPMAALLRDSGVDSDSFQARRVSEQMLKDADLILTMTRAQRSLVVELWPPAVRRAFTMRELARLLDWVGPPPAMATGTLVERLEGAIPLAAAQRGRKRASPEEDDVIDPFRLSNDVYAESFAQIVDAVELIVHAILTKSTGLSTRC